MGQYSGFSQNPNKPPNLSMGFNQQNQNLNQLFSGQGNHSNFVQPMGGYENYGMMNNNMHK